ncbi:site-specific integrase [Microvirga brassicacearum]|uniref:Site-specific integrase n=1 Tax=Microvirga brassicacearum TaxID=2580413 RepID=A0A5N3P4T9_9HYPH|nr:site-specific integrase [Microvirga brassicacearum]KAB0264729.1 site-specific integrase [Microvirga brassicacearum]
MAFEYSITERDRPRTLKSGEIVIHHLYMLNYRDPQTGARRIKSFKRKKDAQRRAAEIAAEVALGTYASKRVSLTIGEVTEHWLVNCAGNVKERTLRGYRHVAGSIVGPLLIGTPRQRADYTETGEAPAGTKFKPLLGSMKVTELTTADIRAWHRLLTNEVGTFTANRAKTYLQAALALAAEDHNIRPPAMPSKLGRGRQKVKKAILGPEQVSILLGGARNDPERGIYYGFPFLTGTRPSEQLALLWEDVDFDTNVIRIRRMQELDGAICEMTKTSAGTREIPMSPTLRAMMLEWRVRCPRRGNELYRVFSSLGQRQAWPKPRTGGGNTLLYSNFRTRFWAPAFKKIGLPYVSPHSARHAFISTLQAQGIEIGLVAKLAGHANAVVTLSHYTQAVRGGEAALEALERAYASAG